MANIKIEDKEVISWLNRIKDNKEAVNRTLKRIQIYGENAFIDEATPLSTTGKLVGSFKNTSNISGTRLRLGSSLGYSYEVMETGSPPNSNINMNNLKRWAGLKLGNKNLAYAVAKNLRKYGTRSYRSGGLKKVTKAVQQIQNKLPDIFKDLMKFYD